MNSLSMLTVNVSLPSDDSEIFIVKAVQSVLELTYQTCVLIVVGDNSSDRTVEIVNASPITLSEC